MRVFRMSACRSQREQQEKLCVQRSAAGVPEWAKIIAAEAFETMDFEAAATGIPRSRMKGLRALLGL
jgi:hypothetical protein